MDRFEVETVEKAKSGSFFLGIISVAEKARPQ